MYFGRGKNKVQEPYTLKHVYEEYYTKQVEKDSIYDVDYKTFRYICEVFNKQIMDYVIHEAGTFMMFSRLGKLRIIKMLYKSNKENKFNVDYKTSNAYGKTIYHLNEHSEGSKFMFYWDKRNSILTHKTYYRFIPTRYNKRSLAAVIKNNECDYFIK